MPRRSCRARSDPSCSIQGSGRGNSVQPSEIFPPGRTRSVLLTQDAAKDEFCSLSHRWRAIRCQRGRKFLSFGCASMWLMTPSSAIRRTPGDRSSIPRPIRRSLGARTSMSRQPNTVARRRTPMDLSTHFHSYPRGHFARCRINASSATPRTEGCNASPRICSKAISIAGVRRANLSVVAIGPIGLAVIRSARRSATSGRLNASSTSSRSVPQRPQLDCRISNTVAARIGIISALVRGKDRRAQRTAAARTGGAQSFRRHAPAANRNASGSPPVTFRRAASRRRPFR